MMDLRALALALSTAACSSSSSSSGSQRDDAIPAGATFRLTGTVTNPFSSVDRGRLVVGVAHSADVRTTIHCDRFLTSMDRDAVILPASYELDMIPQGSYVLVGILIDGSEQAPVGLYSISVDSEGVHAGSQLSVTSLNIACQGTMPYECP